MALINPGPLEWDTTIQSDPSSAMDTGWVEVPFDLKETFGKGNMVPVLATFDGAVTYRGIISKMPFACVILRKDVRAKLGKKGGDPVHVRIELDETTQDVAVPDDFSTHLADADLTDRFAGLTRSQQRSFVEWIESAKQPATRERRVSRAIELLREGRKTPR